jgi:hypothetical protein
VLIIKYSNEKLKPPNNRKANNVKIKRGLYNFLFAIIKKIKFNDNKIIENMIPLLPVKKTDKARRAIGEKNENLQVSANLK